MTAAEDEARSLRLRARLRGEQVGVGDEGEASAIASKAGSVAATVVFWGLPVVGGVVAYRKSKSVAVGALTAVGVVAVETIAVVALAFAATGRAV